MARYSIDSIEHVLRDAVATGTLDEAAVNAAVARWRQAEAQLEEEAARAAEDQENKKSIRVADALKEYNSSTAEISDLYHGLF